MDDEKEKLKNIKDLEYNHILNKQNIVLGFVGTAIISVLLSEKMPQNLSKWDIIFFLIIGGIISLIIFSKQLSKLIEDIREI